MSFGHERLDVYKAALEYVAYVHQLAPRLKGYHRFTRDQLLRASLSILLNIAEGNGKTSTADRRKFFEVARGSALECAGVQDVLEVTGFLVKTENQHPKQLLHRIVSMLSKMH